MTQVSFVVDGLARHYYQAELLLLSLTRFGQVPMQDILVQCTTRVDAVFLAFLQAQGYSYRIIEPFLDGRYCNKLRQLEAFVGADISGVVLLDADMFVLEPLRPTGQAVFCAKVVDHPNPPLTVLQRIFAAAQVPLPPLVSTDAGLPDSTTLAGNFNGGYYAIPPHLIRPLHEGWTTWGQWLFARPELFDNPQQAIHTDQVAMALALAAGGIDHLTIPSNTNCPVHLSEDLKSFVASQPVEILHYHAQLAESGLIEAQAVRAAPILAAVAKANQAIVEHAPAIQFYAGYRRSLVRRPADSGLATPFADRMRSRLTRLGRPLGLILHAGTPKTGTTSQQFALAENALGLSHAGYLYPGNYQPGNGPPKHQWLVSALLAGDLEGLGHRFDEVLDEVRPGIHTIILSTEGIYNHWFDFAEPGRAALASLVTLFDATLWAWFRPQQGFMASYYQQNLKNPQMALVASYGRDLSMAQMLDDTWVARRLDYLGFLMECDAVFGAQQVRAFNYQDDTVVQMAQELGDAFKPGQRPRDNTGLSAAAIAMLRIANRYPLPPSDKQAVVAALRLVDDVMQSYADATAAEPDASARIRALAALQAPVLQVYYGLTTT